jgi:hypothetical protein
VMLVTYLTLGSMSSFDWCLYRDQGVDFPFQKKKLGRVLGPAKQVGNEMKQYILTQNGPIVPRCTVHPLTDSELKQVIIQTRMKIFDNMVLAVWRFDDSCCS